MIRREPKPRPNLTLGLAVKRTLRKHNPRKRPEYDSNPALIEYERKMKEEYRTSNGGW